MADVGVLTPLESAMAGFGELVGGVRAEQWSLPTGCPEWNVRQLVNHMVGGQLLFAALLSDGPAVDRTADHLGDDPLNAFRESAGALLEAFARPGALEREITPPVGTVPAAVALHLRTTEALVHGWDLARATQQDPVFPEEIAEQELAFSKAMLPRVPREGRFAPEQSVPDDASALERLVALLGRPVER